jgi:hypothetical protein
MQDLSKYNIQKLAYSLERESKYELIKELPICGSMSKITEEQAHSVYMLMHGKGFDINLFGLKNSKFQDDNTIFWNENIDKERISPPRVSCEFNDHFVIKEKYRGWENGIKYGI